MICGWKRSCDVRQLPRSRSRAPPHPKSCQAAAARGPCTRLLFVRVHQLPVVPGLQLPRGLGGGQRGVEDEQLPRAVRRLQRTERVLGAQGLREPESKLK